MTDQFPNVQTFTSVSGVPITTEVAGESRGSGEQDPVPRGAEEEAEPEDHRNWPGSWPLLIPEDPLGSWR